MVCDIDNPETLAFGLGKLTTKNEAQKNDIIDVINPFSRTFIHRSVIEMIGVVKKEMFIWGDEKEYTLRAVKNDIRPVTITSAIHFHPQVRSVMKNVIPFVNAFKIILKPSNRSKIYYRNKGYICYTYKPKSVKRIYFFYCLYFVLRLKFGELAKFRCYFKRGCKNIFDISDTK